MRVLMCGSDLNTVKGGMVTVVREYLDCKSWKNSELTYIPTHTSGGRMKKTLYFARAFLRILRLLAGKRVDIAHLHVAERGSFYRKAFLVRLCKRLHVPVILHHHGAEFEDFYEGLNERQKNYVNRILEMADCNLILSDFLEKKLMQKAPHARTVILHNAVTVPKERRYAPDADRILMLGCQGRRKGSYDLLEALALIHERLPAHIRVWMCGDGELADVERMAAGLGLTDRIVLTGWIDGARREECLSRAMLHVLPSHREALPMSILETMGRGIPNIATNIASIPEAVREGDTGFLVEPGEIKKLGERILLLVNDRELREKMSFQSHQLIKEAFSLDICVGRLEGIYRELLKKR